MRKYISLLVAVALLLPWSTATAQVVGHVGDILTVELRLEKGINLVTMPVNPTLETTNDRFMLSDLMRITTAAFVVTVEEGKFNTYLPGLNTKDSIVDGGKGYLIGMRITKTVTMHGLIWAPRTCTQNLVRGLNAIGLPRGVLNGMTTEILRSLVGVPYLIASLNGKFQPYVPGPNAAQPVAEGQAYLFSVPSSKTVTLPIRWPQQKIVYTSSGNGTFKIFTANGDGTNAQMLTTNSAFESHGHWMPNGRDVAFVTDLIPDTGGRSANELRLCVWDETTKQIRTIYTPGAGRAVRRFTVLPNQDMVFEETTYPEGAIHKLWYLNIVSGTKTRITTFDDNVDEFTPSSSINVQGEVTIWFCSNRIGKYQVYSRNVTLGTSVDQITSYSDAQAYLPVLSPDTRSLVITKTQQNPMLVLINERTSRERILVDTSGNDNPGDWESHGEGIIYTSDASGLDRVYKVNVLDNQSSTFLPTRSLANEPNYQPQLFP